VGVTITAEQRDALYDRILDRLSGIGDVWLAANSQDFATAERLGREYSDELRLVHDDLGWGDGPDSGAVELESSPDVLRRVFARLRDTTATERKAQATGWAESRNLEERNRLVSEACASVLRELKEAP
jgi:hypothetical protein